MERIKIIWEGYFRAILTALAWLMVMMSCVQVAVSLISLTGFGVKVSQLIIELAGTHISLALGAAMLTALILGMGMTTTAADLGRIRREVSDSCEAAGLDEERLSRFSICLGEALTNALKHAGGGTATLHRVAGRVIVLVSDEGPGIGELNLPEVALAPGYSTAGTLGMGYKVMISFADRVYLYTGPDGTVVGLEMELVPAGDHPGLPSNSCGAVW